MSIPLLILRPEPGASETAERATAMGLQSLRASLFTIEPVEWDLPDAACFDAVMLTSANAVRTAGNDLSHLEALPVMAVGASTAEAAQSAGLRVALVGNAGAEQLIERARERGFQRLLWLAGREHIYLSSPEIEIKIVYRTQPLKPEILGPAVALLHSARAAARFRELCDERFDQFDVVTISPSVAEAAGKGWRSIRTAARPTDQAMLEIAKPLCHLQSHG